MTDAFLVFTWGMIGGVLVFIPIGGVAYFKWRRHRERIRREAAAWRRYS